MVVIVESWREMLSAKKIMERPEILENCLRVENKTGRVLCEAKLGLELDHRGTGGF